MVSDSRIEAAGPVRRTLLKMVGGATAATLGASSISGSTVADSDENTGHNSASVRVLNWNIAHGEGMDGMYDLRRVVDLINRADPDLVALQEVDRELATRSECDDQPAVLEKLANMHVDFAANLEDYAGSDCRDEAAAEYGTAILTKRSNPILETDHYFLPDSPEQRGLHGIETRVNGQRLKLYTTHLTHQSEDDRMDQSEAIIDILDDESVPHIVTGDFNDTPDSDSIGLLSDRYTDAFVDASEISIPTYMDEEMDDAYTYPAAHWRGDDPHSRIDYIFASSRLSVESATLWETIASDHSPIFADVTLPRDQ